MIAFRDDDCPNCGYRNLIDYLTKEYVCKKCRSRVKRQKEKSNQKFTIKDSRYAGERIQRLRGRLGDYKGHTRDRSIQNAEIKRRC